ncbi:hypothetical protein [Brevibacillus sp. SYSU BS000544]|uniref:hypothetical protein n=1 Tax=Brevibacillus sp. SYSU BS000544 TaxID=3416443 RepID=UPI003CE4FD7E
MYQKRCDRCRRFSYGSDGCGKWICPYCNRDISHLKAKPADLSDSQNVYVVKDLKEDSA